MSVRARRPLTPYVLTFSGTRKRLPANGKAEALRDARYWLDYGVMEVCIHRVAANGKLVLERCLKRPRPLKQVSLLGAASRRTRRK